MACVAGTGPAVGIGRSPVVAQAAAAAATPTLCSDPQSCIDQFASSLRFTNEVESATQTKPQYTPFATSRLTTDVWSARAFEEEADYYYFSQYLQAKTTWAGEGDLVEYVLDTTNTLVGATATTLDAFPPTTSCTTAVTNTNTTSVNGSVGVASSPPTFLNLGITGSSSWSRQTNTTCPSLQITQVVEPTSIEMSYVASGRNYNAEAFSMSQQWVWKVPWGSDPTAGITVDVAFHGPLDTHNNPTYNIPAPFDSFTIPPPTVGSVTPTTACPGNVVSVAGTNLFPNGINDVQIGGVAIDSSLWSAVQDGDNDTILVIVPDSAPIGSNLVGVSVNDVLVTGPKITINASCSGA